MDASGDHLQLSNTLEDALTLKVLSKIATDDMFVKVILQEKQNMIFHVNRLLGERFI